MGNPKTANELAATIEGAKVVGDDAAQVSDVTHDSRQAGSGKLFVAIRGERSDGHAFVEAAVRDGSNVICVDHEMASGATEIVVADTRAALGPLAASIHGHPSREMNVIGVTGTNGKTTVTHYIESIARTAGLGTGLIGTIETRIGIESLDSPHTTPEASDFQRLLATMRDREIEVVGVEVSSHALALGRVAATVFGVAAFTNLSQDHLDFHGDMKTYQATKERLFHDYEVSHGVVNIDDSVGRGIAERFAGDLATVGERGDVKAANIVIGHSGSSFDLSTPWGSARVGTPIVGRFNVDNAVLAAACLLVSGLDFKEVVSGLEVLSGVPGRYELVSGTDPIRVIVDYAHTPDGITRALSTARELGSGRVIALVGAGGDRDTQKRSLMGEAISAADLAVITSDNPRSEDPVSIVSSVVAGVDLRTESLVEVDRHQAINQAISLARDGDVVLVLGRGHEPTQDVGGRKIPFDDREVAREALHRRRIATDSGTDSGSMAR
jgi:UDP-N-acetylmuramoyl-L-alanyl-D-glutamate--2,6-diaminopimelate ligase